MTSRQKMWRLKNRERVREYNRRYRHERYDICDAIRRRSDAKPRSRWLRSRRLALRRGLSWTIGFRAFSQLIKLPCHYCGGELPWSCSGLDRINNSKGYTRSNVVPCCRLCNWMKRDLSRKQFLAHIARIHATHQ